ncbi:MAG: hypothetical protein KPEEDBHJ_00259 [Anaerolineales bacterium]|nr:hypothetical protein [Anaerolineales bacterium]
MNRIHLPSSRGVLILVIVGLGAVIYFLAMDVLFLAGHLDSSFDDAYMFIRYARNLLGGHGIAWNSDGVQTYGATSLLYLFWIAAALAVFPSAAPGAILAVSSFTFGLGYVTVLALGTIKFATSDFLKRNSLLFPVFTAAALMVSKYFRLHSISGMDTTLSVFCNSLLAVATIAWAKKPGRAALAWLTLAAYASFLTRPDVLLYALLFPLLYGWFFLGEERNRNIVRFLIAFTAILALDTLIKFLIFGDPLPLPFYTKRAGFFDGYRGAAMWNPVEYLFIFFRLTLPFLGVLLFTANSKSGRLVAAFFTPVVLTFAYFFSVTQVMGFWARYYFPALPFFVMGSFISLEARLRESERPLLPFFSLRGALAAVALLFFFLPFPEKMFIRLYETRFIPPPTIYKSAIARNLDGDVPKLGWRTSINGISEICLRLPFGTRIAMSEYGLVGALAPQIYIIDLIGLHDPVFAHNGFFTQGLFRRNPDIIWFPPPDYTKIVAALQDDDTLLEDYDYYPNAFDYGLAVRRDADAYELITEALAATWVKYYPDLELKRYPP